MPKNGIAKNASIPIVGVVRVEPRVHDMDGVHQMAFHGPCGLLLYALDFRHLEIFIDSYRTYVLTSVVLISRIRVKRRPSLPSFRPFPLTLIESILLPTPTP